MKKKICFVVIIITIFVLTGCLSNSSDSNINDIESKNNDVLRTTDEIKNVLENVALPYTCGEESGLINIEGEKIFSMEEDWIYPTYDDKYWICGNEIRKIDGSNVVNSGCGDSVFYLGDNMFVQTTVIGEVLGEDKYAVQAFNVNKEGAVELPLSNISEVVPFQNGIAMVKGEGFDQYEIIYIGTDGKLITNKIFRSGTGFNSNSEALVLDEDNTYKYINKYGSIVRTTNYTASDFSILFSCPNSDLVAISKNPGEYMINGEEILADGGKFGYLNTKTGEIIGLYDNVANLTELNGETYANVYLEDKGWGLMDVASGETAIECQYSSSTGLFRNGLVSLQKESLFGCINVTGEEVVPFSFIDPVEFGNRGNWTVGNKLSEIDIVLIGEYVLLTTENGKCVESEIPGLKEGDEPKVNLFNATDKNCTIQLLNDSNHDNVIESTRYINPWTGEIICEVGN